MKNQPSIRLKSSVITWPLFYYGETAVGIDNTNWNDLKSRDFQWESAVETIRCIVPEDFNNLDKLVKEAALCSTKKELDELEERFYEKVVTGGSFKKRKKYYSFIACVFTNSIPSGLDVKLVTCPKTTSPFILSNKRAKVTQALVRLAKRMLDEGTNPFLYFKAYYESGKEDDANLVKPLNKLTDDPDITSSYRSLSEWSKKT